VSYHVNMTKYNGYKKREEIMQWWMRSGNEGDVRSFVELLAYLYTERDMSGVGISKLIAEGCGVKYSARSVQRVLGREGVDVLRSRLEGRRKRNLKIGAI